MTDAWINIDPRPLHAPLVTRKLPPRDLCTSRRVEIAVVAVVHHVRRAYALSTDFLLLSSGVELWLKRLPHFEREVLVDDGDASLTTDIVTDRTVLEHLGLPHFTDARLPESALSGWTALDGCVWRVDFERAP